MCFSWYSFSFEPRKRETSGGMKNVSPWGTGGVASNGSALLFFLFSFSIFSCFVSSFHIVIIFNGAYLHMSGACFHHIDNDPLPWFQRMSPTTTFYRMRHIMEDKPTIVTPLTFGFSKRETVKARATTRIRFSKSHYIFCYFCTCHSMRGSS